MEQITFGGWPNCLRIEHGGVEAIVTTDIGPRIVRFGPVDGPNLLKEIPEEQGARGGSEWRLYGGHRLWHAPEAKPRTYAPDNDPVPFEADGDGLRLAPAVEASTGIQKELTLRFDPADGALRIRHRLINRGPWPIETACWALTVMAAGGRAILPQEPFRSHAEALLPARPMALWHYTDMSDPRWTWGRRFVQLRQDPERAAPQKLGLLNRRGWAAYTVHGHTLLKRYACVAGADYPDFGCNTEVFTNEIMLELETLGPRVRLAADGGATEHEERWSLLPFEPSGTEDAIAAQLEPHLAGGKQECGSATA